MSVSDFVDAERLARAWVAIRAARERGEARLAGGRRGDGDPRVAFASQLGGHEMDVRTIPAVCGHCRLPWSDELAEQPCRRGGS